MENQNLKAEILDLLAEKENTDELLKQALTENKALKEKIRLLESSQGGCTTSPRPFCRDVADALCEELVLLDEDIAFITAIVKPEEVDPYTSNLGRVQSARATTAATAPPAPPPNMSVSEQLLAASLQQHQTTQKQTTLLLPPHAALTSLDEEEEGEGGGEE